MVDDSSSTSSCTSVFVAAFLDSSEIFGIGVPAAKASEMAMKRLLGFGMPRLLRVLSRRAIHALILDALRVRLIVCNPRTALLVSLVESTLDHQVWSEGLHRTSSVVRETYIEPILHGLLVCTAVCTNSALNGARYWEP